MARAVETAVWWAVLVGVWLTTLSSVDGQDLVLAAVLAVPCAITATVVRGAYGGRWQPASAWPLPLAVIRGCGALFSRHAERRTIPVRPIQKAVKTVIVSASPNTVVLDDKGSELQVHALGRE